MPDQGWFLPNTQYRKVHVWVCLSCLSKPQRQHRKGLESPLEKKVREAIYVFGEPFIAEYKVGAAKFLYDFAFPKLKLLLEVDSRTWHRSERKRRVDAVKKANAVTHGWKLVRVFNGPKVGLRAVRLVRARRYQLLRRFDSNPDVVEMLYQEKYGDGGNY
jgi:very-short-patch-repair endonuclease